MNKESLYEAIGDINEEYIKAARDSKYKKSLVWLKWAAAAACLCIAAAGFFGMYLESLPHKGTANLVNGFEGEIIEIVDERHCVVRIEHGAGVLGQGDTAYVIYEGIIKSGETYNGKLAVGNRVSVTYYDDQMKIENGQSIIRLEKIELLGSPVN